MSDLVLEAVCWDMDGTLIDSERYWMETEAELVEAYGGHWTAVQAHACIGADLSVTAAHIIEAGVELSVPEAIRQLSAGVARRLHEHGIPWRPGVVSLLTAVRDAGIPQAMVTMSHSENAHRIATAAPDGVFDLVISGDKVVHGKPHPEPYLTAVEHLGVRCDRTIAFEDSSTGLSSATGANVVTIGIPCVEHLTPGQGYTLWPTLEGVDVAALDRFVQERYRD